MIEKQFIMLEGVFRVEIMKDTIPGIACSIKGVEHYNIGNALDSEQNRKRIVFYETVHHVYRY